jgi:hypothetical protein
VTVCPVVADGAVTGLSVKGSCAELTVLKATPNTLIAIAALAPTAAEITLYRLELMSGWSFRSNNWGD